MKTPEPIGQQGRWLDLLSEYISIQQRPGMIHGNNDSLSRRPCQLTDSWIVGSVDGKPLGLTRLTYRTGSWHRDSRDSTATVIGVTSAAVARPKSVRVFGLVRRYCSTHRL